MFLVTLRYIVELNEIEKHLQSHVDYLDRQYALNHFLASGRQVPRTGGVILADVEDRETLEAVLAEDPFKIHSMADYDIIEFIPTKTSPELSFLKQA